MLLLLLLSFLFVGRARAPGILMPHIVKCVVLKLCVWIQNGLTLDSHAGELKASLLYRTQNSEKKKIDTQQN